MGKRRPTPEMDEILRGQAKESVPSQAQRRPLTKDEVKKAKEKAQMKKRLPHRATYDLPPGMKEQIVEIANEHGTTASQVAAFLLDRGLRQVKSKSINLDQYKEPSTSLRWEYNLRIDD